MRRTALLLWIIGFGGLLAGCEIIGNDSDPDPGEGDLVWVSKLISGGRQCAPHIPFVPRETKEVLEDAGVKVFDTATRSLAVCEACHCPDYHVEHFARIRESNLEQAGSVGFERSEDPPPR